MKNLLLLFICCSLFSFQSKAQCGNLYIAGVVDGSLSGGTPKGMQICATADVADLSIYGIGSANNGGGTDGQEFTFPDDIVAAGDCFWIASESPQFTTFFGFAPCYTSGSMGINGDDAVELFCSGAVVDVFGDINTDGTGQAWEYLNGWATAADAVPSTTFVVAEWTYSGVNGLEGGMDNTTADVPYPSPAQECPVPLPVELISFSAKAQKESIDLNWSTASEENNSHFEVEYSTNGRDFKMVDKVIGNGTTAEIQTYQFIHADAATGKNYYRLKQVDFDGAFEYSDVVVVSMRTEAVIEIRPTMVASSIQIFLEEELTTNVAVQIVDLTGRQLQTATIAKGIQQFDLNVNELDKGAYFVQFNVAGEVITRRFVKM